MMGTRRTRPLGIHGLLILYAGLLCAYGRGGHLAPYLRRAWRYGYTGWRMLREHSRRVWPEVPPWRVRRATCGKRKRV